MTVPTVRRNNNLRRAIQKVIQVSKKSGITIRRRGGRNLEEEDDELLFGKGAVSTDGENEDEDENDSSSSSTSSSIVTIGSVHNVTAAQSTTMQQQQQRSPTVVQFDDKLKVYVYYIDAMSNIDKEQLYYSKAERIVMEQQLRQEVYLLRSMQPTNNINNNDSYNSKDYYNNNSTDDNSSSYKDITFTPTTGITRFPAPNPLSPTIHTTANTNTITTDRGVEHYINLELQDEIKVRQKMVVRAVLTEQAYQRESNIIDPEAIRTFYMEISKLSKGLAFQLAHNTSEEENDNSNNDDNDNTTSSSLLEL